MSPENRQAEPSPDIERRYLKLEDVALYLSVSVPQVYALVRSGELPAVKLGGRGIWRVDRQKLDAYLEHLEEETREWAKAHPLNRREAAAADELAEPQGGPKVSSHGTGKRRGGRGR